MLKQKFTSLLAHYCNDDRLIQECWLEIEKNYSSSERYYHTLAHLEHLLVQLTEIRQELVNWDAVLFALFYHDLVYDVSQQDNEEKSAQLAVKRMLQIGVPPTEIELAVQYIWATKSHHAGTHSDTNYFTDADLSVLGSSRETYALYAQNVRKEYAIYPDSIYQPGRKKVLQHFLEMERIYKTDYFHAIFEMTAKENIFEELSRL